MLRNFTLDYWTDGDWLVGKLREVPGVFSQGKTLEELENNIREAYQLMMEEQTSSIAAEITTHEMAIEV